MMTPLKIELGLFLKSRNSGHTFKEKVVKHPETGERQTIRKRKAVRPWYYDADEHYYFEIKLGLKSM